MNNGQNWCDPSSIKLKGGQYHHKSSMKINMCSKTNRILFLYLLHSINRLFSHGAILRFCDQVFRPRRYFGLGGTTIQHYFQVSAGVIAVIALILYVLVSYLNILTQHSIGTQLLEVVSTILWSAGRLK